MHGRALVQGHVSKGSGCTFMCMRPYVLMAVSISTMLLSHKQLHTHSRHWQHFGKLQCST
jgi:hypothetical protein